MDLETLPVNMRDRMATKNTSFNALGDVAHADPNKCGATMADLVKS